MEPYLVTNSMSFGALLAWGIVAFVMIGFGILIISSAVHQYVQKERAAALQKGIDRGYGFGYFHGAEVGNRAGYRRGWRVGYEIGRCDGYSAGHSDGYAKGYRVGHHHGGFQNMVDQGITQLEHLANGN